MLDLVEKFRSELAIVSTTGKGDIPFLPIGSYAFIFQSISLNLAEEAVSSIPEEALYCRVVDYWDKTSGWKWDELESILQVETLSKLATSQQPSSGMMMAKYGIEVWSISLIEREQNVTADALAKLARRWAKGMHVLKQPPTEIFAFPY
nr:F-box/kelch-repeat protein At1g80440-like [Ipomoea batatas]